VIEATSPTSPKKKKRGFVKLTNLEKTHEYLKNKQKLLLQLQRTKKRKIIKEFTNERNMFGFSIKGLKKRRALGNEISGKKSQLGI
jgi:hypothetical protein